MAQDDFLALLDMLVGDGEGDISPDDRKAVLNMAVLRYSVDRPRAEIKDIIGGDYWLDIPNWCQGFTRIVSIETPVDQTPPVLLANWQIYENDGVARVLLASALPAASPVRVKLTAAHLLDDGNDTIPPQDREAVANWAAALLLDKLANQTAGSRDPLIAADTVNYQNKSRDYTRRAEASRQFYRDHLGLNEKRTTAAGAVVTVQRRRHMGGMFQRRP